MLQSSTDTIATSLMHLLNGTSIFDAMSDAISVQDTTLRVLYQNPAHKQLTGEHIGEYCYTAYQNKDEVCEGCHLIQSFKDGLCHIREVSKITDLGLRYLEISSSPLRDSDGTIVGGIESIRDMTERKKLMEELSYSRECFSQALNGSQHVLYRLDVKKGCYDYLSPIFEKITGHPVTEFKQKNLKQVNEYFHPDDRDRIFAAIDNASRTRTGNTFSLDLEYRFKKANGCYCWLHDSTTACFDDDGDLECFFGSANDISQRKEAEELLAKNEERLQAIFDTMQAGIILVNPYGTVTFANQRMADMFGCTLDALIGSTYPEHLHPDQKQQGDERMRKLIAGEIDHVYSERHYICKDGRDFWGHLSGRRLEDVDGNLILLVGVIADISELKKTQHELQASEIKYRRFSSMTSDFLTICHRRASDPFRVEWLGGSVEAITGYSKEQILDWGCWISIIHPDDMQRINQRLLEQKPGSVNTDDFRLIRKDGEVRWIHEVSRCEEGDGPEIIRYGTAQDISKRKEAEDEIRNLNEHLEHLVIERTTALERSNEELATFCYAVSHELRAPIARLQGFSNLLGESCKDSGDVSFLAARIANASQHLQSVVDAILQLGRLSNSELSLQNIDLSEMVTRELKLLCDESPERNLEFNVTPGVMAVADSKLITICIQNLIGNAFKYTGQTTNARIEFGVIHEDGNEVYFVRDNGAGFDMAYSDKLFTPFQRLHLQNEFDGIGIGLATVKRIVELHGGEIWAKSSIGQGATFSFTLRRNK